MCLYGLTFTNGTFFIFFLQLEFRVLLPPHEHRPLPLTFRLACPELRGVLSLSKGRELGTTPRRKVLPPEFARQGPNFGS
jgi:hypothetical protein